MADPCLIWNILMFSPSLVCESSAVSARSSYSPTNMASADFLAYRNQIYSKTSPGKSFFLHPIPAASTKKTMVVFFGRYNDVLAYPHFVASYAVSVRQYRIL